MDNVLVLVHNTMDFVAHPDRFWARIFSIEISLLVFCFMMGGNFVITTILVGFITGSAAGIISFAITQWLFKYQVLNLSKWVVEHGRLNEAINGFLYLVVLCYQITPMWSLLIWCSKLLLSASINTHYKSRALNDVIDSLASFTFAMFHISVQCHLPNSFRLFLPLTFMLSCLVPYFVLRVFAAPAEVPAPTRDKGD